MIQILIGLALGLVLVAFFVAAMYYILPDEAVDKALSRFEDLRRDLLDTTIGRIIYILLSPLVALTNALLGFIAAIGDKAGPLTGFSIALIGLLRSSRGLIAIFDVERAMDSADALVRATVVLISLGGVGAIARVARQGLKSLLTVPVLAFNRSRFPKKTRSRAYKAAYIALVILVLLFGIHVVHTAVEIMRPNSRINGRLETIDLLEKFYLYAVNEIKIR